MDNFKFVFNSAHPGEKFTTQSLKLLLLDGKSNTSVHWHWYIISKTQVNLFKRGWYCQ